MATVARNSDSPYWRADFTLSNGKRVRKTTKETNKKLALKIAHEMEAQAEAALATAPPKGAKTPITLRDALELYIMKHSANPESGAPYRAQKLMGMVEGVAGLDPDKLIHEITSTELLEFRQKRLAQGAAKQTIQHELNALSAALNMAKLDHIVNPSLQVPRFTIESTPRPLTDAEVDRLLGHLTPTRSIDSRTGEPYGFDYGARGVQHILDMRQDNYDMVVCLLNTGLRFGELVSLTWDQVNTTDWSIRIQRTKNADKRSVARGRNMDMHPPSVVKAILQRRYAARGTIRHIFSAWETDPTGHWVRRDEPRDGTIAVRHALDVIGVNSDENVERYGRRDVRSLRDTFATRLRRAGVGLEDIKELLGHSTITMTMKYADFGLDSVSKNASSVLEKFNQ